VSHNIDNVNASNDESELATDFLQQQHPSSTGTPPEWQDVPPDAILAKVKTLKQEFLESKGLCPFYKSYNSWEKMSADQWDKAAAWFR
jgi:hypothetical protein